MIFRLLGQTVRRAWPLLLAGWAALLLGTWAAAPPWAEYAQDKEFAFLPEYAPSRQAEEVFAKAFPEDRLAGNIVLVLHRPEGAAQREGDLKFIEDVLEPGLRKIAEDEGGLADEPAPSDDPLFAEEAEPAAKPAKRSIIARVRTPNALGTGALLVSAEGNAMLVVVELTTEFLTNANWPTIDKVEALVRDVKERGKLPPGAELAVTGSAVIGRDHNLAQLRSARATELLTVVLVIVLLVLIYRAPLLAIIPLATVALAVKLSLNLLALLAEAGYVTLFQGIEIYITILSYGAGVDYCLFLTARYQEELGRGASPADAIAAAVGGVGAALTASAATVIGGIGMMAFAEFGKFREAGWAIPLSLVLVLAATLTFTPALLRLAGRWAFWPRRPEQVADAAAAPHHRRFNLDGLARVWDRMGRVLLRRPGTVWLAAVALMAPFAIAAVLLYNRLSYDLVSSLPADAPSVVGTRVLKRHFPQGLVGPVTAVLVNPDVDFGAAKGREVVRGLTDRLRAEREDLGLADVRSLTAPLGITAAAAGAFEGSDLPPEVRREAVRQGARAHYVSTLGERAPIGTRLDLVLTTNPFSEESVANLARVEEAIRAALPEGLREKTQVHFVGPTASVRDLASVMDSDRVRIELLVLASVFVILILLLRRVVLTAYLLVSVLFSYYATLGVAFAVFWALDPQGFTGIDWKVSIFLFTILIAVGEDYNIFLLTRVDEESERFGPVRGVTEALTRTGPIISSCGIIMAGTFGSLLAGSLAEMKQLGFALAFGVLLDTFVVRPILVPAFLILQRTGRLSPARWLSRGAPRESRHPEEASPSR